MSQHKQNMAKADDDIYDKYLTANILDNINHPLMFHDSDHEQSGCYDYRNGEDETNDEIYYLKYIVTFFTNMQHLDQPLTCSINLREVRDKKICFRSRLA